METLPHIKQEPTSERDWHQALMELARYLRTPEGCPWDQKQTARTFAEFHVEESAEYVEALDGDDPQHMAEECGDALFTLLASVAAAEAEGRFTYEEMLRAAHEKMIRRHDHVFGPEKARTPEEAMAAWERAKAAEHARKNTTEPH